ncbi:hypothetical protein LCM20_09985 [Halobacillus litoralis]|uniref:hypothetical protein n=1 Tax=Halobacillus litoralis TaxID=45668 RepID=UPI001CD23B6F|nr:hypothetical protein [Halobacillus litoralis]MCA0970920.1 hypothetical protein [Halobacillus litoralis]
MERDDSLAYATVALKELGYDNADIESITNKMLEVIRRMPDEKAEQMADKILFDGPPETGI